MDKIDSRIIKKIAFFKDKEILDMETIADNKAKIETGSEIYVLGFYPIEEFDSLNNELRVSQYLKSRNFEMLQTFDVGLIPDIDCAFKISQYRREEALMDYLKGLDETDLLAIACEFGKTFRKLHQLGDFNYNENWYSKFNKRLNLVMYNHAMIDQKQDKTYTIIDYINQNKHIARNTSGSLLYNNYDLKNIRVSKNRINLKGIKDIRYGDGVSDLLLLNSIALKYPKFAIEALNAYNDYKPVTRKIFRLLSLYQAVFLLENIAANVKGEVSGLSNDEVKQIYNMYDGFTNIYPSWYR